MSSKTTQWILEFIDKITAPLRSVEGAADDAAGAAGKLDEKLGKINKTGSSFPNLAVKVGAASFAFNQISDAVQKANNEFQKTIAPGVRFQSGLADLSAVTQISGKELEELGNKAKNLSKEFGGDPAQQLESFKGIIGRFGPDIAKNNEVLEGMGRNVAILSKQMDNDAVGAMTSLTTSMLQFGVDLSNPTEALSEMTRMMNVMVAAGNEGGSEVADTAKALEESGLLARNAGVSFEEANAALQALDKGSLKGSEAGTAFRNILLDISSTALVTPETLGRMQLMGVDFKKLTDKTIPLTERLRELKKVEHDTGVMTDFFRRSGVAAGGTLLEHIDLIDDLVPKITGTNAAYEGASTVMETYAEKLSRMQAKVDDLKITFFNVVEPIAPFMSIAGDAMTSVSSLGIAVFGLSVLFKKDLYKSIFSAIKAVSSWTVWSRIATVATTIFKGVMIALKVAFGVMTSPIGIIAALAGAIIFCWNKFEGFRAFLVGMWEVIKKFGTIIKDYVIDRIKGLLSGISAMGQAIGKLFKGDFSGAWKSAKEGVSGLLGVDARKNAYEAAKGLGEAYEKGAAAGRASFQKSQEEKRGNQTVIPDTPVVVVEEKPEEKLREVVIGMPKPKEGDTQIGNGFVYQYKDGSWVKIGSENKKNSGKTDESGISLSGGSSGSGSGGKSITINVTLNNNFSGVKNPQEIADLILRQINDRLNDTLAQVG